MAYFADGDSTSLLFWVDVMPAGQLVPPGWETTRTEVLICTVEDAKRMLADVNSPHLGIALDSFHMNIEEVDFCAAVKQAGEQLVHVQVSDSHRGVPGDGNSDWAGLREGLRAIDYKGKLSIESFSPDASSLADAVCIYQRFAPTQDEFAQRGLDFLRRWWAQA